MPLHARFLDLGVIHAGIFGKEDLDRYIFGPKVKSSCFMQDHIQSRRDTGSNLDRKNSLSEVRGIFLRQKNKVDHLLDDHFIGDKQFKPALNFQYHAIRQTPDL